MISKWSMVFWLIIWSANVTKTSVMYNFLVEMFLFGVFVAERSDHKNFFYETPCKFLVTIHLSLRIGYKFCSHYSSFTVRFRFSFSFSQSPSIKPPTTKPPSAMVATSSPTTKPPVIVAAGGDGDPKGNPKLAEAVAYHGTQIGLSTCSLFIFGIDKNSNFVVVFYAMWVILVIGFRKYGISIFYAPN